uniref:Trichome birefringence-like C-terminal domain-containing protein n=1 Tax=Ditylum brightwellii TaxID=49249 RepID=A0A7S4SCW6_9STRA
MSPRGLQPSDSSDTTLQKRKKETTDISCVCYQLKRKPIHRLQRSANLTLRAMLVFALVPLACHTPGIGGSQASQNNIRGSRHLAYNDIVITNTTDEPSHIRMCRYLMPRLDYVTESGDLLKKAYSMGIMKQSIEDLTPGELEKLGIVDSGEDSKGMPVRPPEMDELYIVEEDEEVCVDTSAPHSNLLQIFSSHLLSIASRKFMLNVEYRHKCHRWRGKREDLLEKPTTIQEMLSSSLLIDADEGFAIDEIPLELLAIRTLCAGCIKEVEEVGIPKRNCALFSRPTVYDAVTAKKANHIAMKAAGISSSVHSYSKGTGFMLAPMKEDTISNPSEQTQLPIGIVAIMPSIRRNLLHVSDMFDEGLTAFYGGEEARINSLASRVGQIENLTSVIAEHGQGEQGAYSHLTDDDAVIYLNCVREHCAGEELALSFAVPNYIYLLHIPVHVSRIRVVVAKDCADHIQGCRDHGQELITFLTKYFPRSSVRYIEEASTFAAYSRMMLADYLVCPPGISCFIPSLVSGVAKSVLFGDSRIVPWLSELGEAELRNVTLLDMQETPVASVDKANFDVFMNKFPDLEQKQCRFLRGRVGTWEQDIESAYLFQYKTPILHYVGQANLRYIPTVETPYRLPTTYRWQEDLFELCNIKLLTRDGMCKVMKDLGMSRIFMIGDSLGMNMGQSLFKLMGYEESTFEPGSKHQNFEKMVQCNPDNSENDFLVTSIRSDRIIENGEPVDEEKEFKNCHDYCHPWSERYKSYNGDTLFIVNTGPHFQLHRQFQAAFDEFVAKIDSYYRPRDVILWRTTVPGHPNCNETIDQKPFNSFEEYAATEVTDFYSWNKFVGYNDYVTKAFDMRKREVPGPSRARMELLDVYPMTVQRPDGHVSSGECPECPGAKGFAKDCLHYSLPGPPDWWNHLMYNHLLDLSLQDS